MDYENLKITQWALEDRPREKMMQKGLGSLSDAELIAILIGSGTRNETAVSLGQRILKTADNNLNELGKFTLTDFTAIKGIGEAKAITIMAAIELGRRRKRSEALNRKQITSSSDVIEVFQPLLADLPHEEFWVLFLNRANKIIDKQRITQGGVTGTIFDVKLILKAAIERLASSLIVCHNHPSGNKSPSEQDIQITSKLKDASRLFDISLLDHVIVTDSVCYSFADNGAL
ncbi:MAG: DNA repair protein RadC [Bacteroidales bacterium]|nr:DNA repair protein RadC [Bacteroidales bacterium]MBN2750960.1 DNA repair protein RadC [Bacteroidales bacterium]